MTKFEQWFSTQDFYTNMRFIHGDGLFCKDGDVYRVLPVQMTYVAWGKKPDLGKPFDFDLLEAKQAEIDEKDKRIVELECRVSKVVRMLEGDLNYVRQDRRGNFEFLQMAMIRCFESDIKTLRGEQ